MKRYVFFILLIIGCWGCHKPTPGYLEVVNAKYVPDTMIIRKELDPNLDGGRKDNNAPWVSPKMQGVIGTAPLQYEILDVKAENGGDAALFKSLLEIRGGGRMEFPLRSQVPTGRYIVSVRVSNEGYERDVLDIFTFIVK